LNNQHLHYQFPAEPFQRWHVIEDRSLPRSLRFRHPCKPDEKPNPKENFGVSELSARLEHAGVEYIRIVGAGEKEHQFCRFGEQQPRRRGRGQKLYSSF
jgi:hypothetical protein